MSEPVLNSLLIILSAPSGGGKTTLCEQILAGNPSTVRAITCTTRPPRANEKDGVDYYFMDAANFLKRVQAGHFLEHATVYGNSYGTLKSEVLSKLRSGKDVLLSVDVQGAATITERSEEESEIKRALVTVFITPPSLAILEERLRKRGQDSPEVIKRRLAVARQEVSQWKHFDYLILSRSIPEDTKRMQAIIAAEKMRQFRTQPFVFE
jgi:guanylate kinase